MDLTTWLFKVDWHAAFVPDVSPLEIVVRGTVTYLALFIMLRVVLKRETGGIGITDILVIVLISDASQNAMAGEYRSITDGILLVGVIICWSFLLDWLAFQYPWLERLLHPPPLPLIRHGQKLRRNMRREFITDEELMSHLRQQGIEDIAEVELAFMESNGVISVIKSKSDDDQSTNVAARGCPL